MQSQNTIGELELIVDSIDVPLKTYLNELGIVECEEYGYNVVYRTYKLTFESKEKMVKYIMENS